MVKEEKDVERMMKLLQQLIYSIKLEEFFLFDEKGLVQRFKEMVKENFHVQMPEVDEEDLENHYNIFETPHEDNLLQIILETT